MEQHANALVRDFAKKGYHGFYSEVGDFIILREGKAMASMLVHELAHRGQHIEGPADDSAIIADIRTNPE